MTTRTFVDRIIPNTVGRDGSYTMDRLITTWRDGRIVGWNMVQKFVQF